MHETKISCMLHVGILIVPVHGARTGARSSVARIASDCRPDAAAQRLPNLEHKVMRQQIQRVSRTIEVNDHTLTVDEHTELENEAGAVVWDAALVLLNYFCTGKTGFGISLAASRKRQLPRLPRFQRLQPPLVRLCFADPSLVQGKRCIELGAGTGVVGLTAALLGAQVVLTGSKA